MSSTWSRSHTRHRCDCSQEGCDRRTACHPVGQSALSSEVSRGGPFAPAAASSPAPADRRTCWPRPCPPTRPAPPRPLGEQAGLPRRPATPRGQASTASRHQESAGAPGHCQRRAMAGPTCGGWWRLATQMRRVGGAEVAGTAGVGTRGRRAPGRSGRPCRQRSSSKGESRGRAPTPPDPMHAGGVCVSEGASCLTASDTEIKNSQSRSRSW